MSADPDSLTIVANQGWERPDARCPYLATSRSSDAWHLGAHLSRNGSPRPSHVKASRGDSLRFNRTSIARLSYGPRGETTITAIEAA